ncbi:MULTISPECIES: hypothetical protein [Pseudomonas]|uniref:hypothetical protein n=1 Tax=Pseudomonas TaxID=286 RepID=UPI001269EB97|nr:MULTISPECIES: hypothetical protein [Pseudomonas]MCO7534921.1 hypothetical protein [Pseudomonas asiatica]MCO7548054.1 hypothetical protein [Pseudomonas asiatica]MCO7558896.1 hypothetical protein [Pseudomonas asiatica]
MSERESNNQTETIPLAAPQPHQQVRGILRSILTPFLIFHSDVDASLKQFASKASAITMFAYIVLIIGTVIFLSITRNPDVFKLQKDTQEALAQFYNVMIWMLVPLVLGAMGAAARVMLAGLKVGSSGKLIFSSGLMAAFSWLGIKSKILLALIAPHLAATPHVLQPVDSTIGVEHIGTEFYSMALIAVMVGMFASNIYIFINQRVEKLTQEAQNERSNTPTSVKAD